NDGAQQPQHQMFGPNIINHQPPSNMPISGPPGPGVPGFGGPLQQDPARMQQIPFGGQMTPGHQMPAGAPALGQGGQQPILNDALSYLDQVKVQFADQPDVYNRFLDIMKDFKSQAIDTPGVINRVSELFAGHPNLIQGFNTFLPPGYRIECGAGNDPNTIRVTTPMGTTVQSITGGGRSLQDSTMGQGSAGGGYYGGQRSGAWQQQGQHNTESPESVFSPPNQGGAAYGQSQGPHASYEAQQAAAAHQQQQRGVSQLTNAVSALGHPPRNAVTPTPGGQSMNGSGQQPGMEKRGPVEFNHAISYVNKIKNRFQDKPEIYKQFLEILQTYQRESKPIQDVYAQVTTLFSTAPDLLEDFKQFLPESAAQAKAAAKAAEDAAAMSGAAQTPQVAHGARGEAKMPPVGNFAVPASTSKENKKRPRTNLPVSGPQLNIQESSVRMGPVPMTNKRTKLHHNKPMASDAPAVSPTLTPVMPEPLPPTTTSGATSEELAFFDRVKKYIGNKSTMNEFLKLCNLFSQDLIDRNVLVHKVSNFIGGNPDLMNWFKAFVNYDGEDEVIENKPKPPTGKVSLSNCRGLGPSYRLLPKRERLKPCSGRDEMCMSVLNDDWASHPTWASEDSGFVAHRKNIFEESLHRIEEERHDYDFNIEANAKVIQLLEPIGQSILAMDPAERAHFRMPLSINGQSGQSEAIYRRVLKKIYGAKGLEVVADLFKDPCAVLPVVLARLKQKDEEWRFTQREWEKVWRAQTQAMYLKSLDHMGISVKQSDKKNFATKHLVDSIKTKYEEQRRQRATKGRTPKYQFKYEFSDQEVVADVLRIMVLYASNASQHNSAERRRIVDFFERFVMTFFDISEDLVTDRTGDIDRGTPDDDEDLASELPNGRGRKPFGGRKNDLRRGVLDKGRNGTRAGQKDDSATGSKESTPDVDSAADDDMVDAPEDPSVTEVTNERWTGLPEATAVEGSAPLDAKDADLTSDQPFRREWYSFYCNQTIYVFFSIFQTLYRRLHEIKNDEGEALAELQRIRRHRPADEIGVMDSRDKYFGEMNGESFYSRTLLLVEDYILGEVEEPKYHDILRHFYLQKGWQLYTVNDLLKGLSRLGAICSSVDPKEKTPRLFEEFQKNRALKETSFNTEINLRKTADKYNKDGELFLIKWWPSTNEATLQIVQKDETTFDLDDMERKERWKYYTSSYVRIEPTEGIPRRQIRKSVLTRNLPSGDTDSEDGFISRKPILWEEDLILRICVNSYKILFKAPGKEWFLYADTLGSDKDPGTKERAEKITELRSQKFREKFVMNTPWMKDLDHEQVQKVNEDFEKWMKDGIVPGTQPAPTAGTEVAAR
ncbi:hypothetical protein DH86_00002181, partial [Scytalidium sp. 3C]